MHKSHNCYIDTFFAAHDIEDSRRGNLSHAVAAMCIIIKEFCTANEHALPPIVQLPVCRLRSVFIADGTLFRNDKGEITPPDHHFDDLLCLRGASFRAQVLASFVDEIEDEDMGGDNDDDGEKDASVDHTRTTDLTSSVGTLYEQFAENNLLVADSESDDDERTGIYSVYVQEPPEVRFEDNIDEHFCYKLFYFFCSVSNKLK